MAMLKASSICSQSSLSQATVHDQRLGCCWRHRTSRQCTLQIQAVKADAPSKSALLESSMTSKELSRTHSGVEEGSLQPKPVSDPLQGFPELFFVSILWGSFGPAMKLLYEDGQHLDPSTITAFRSVVSASALVGAAIYATLKQQTNAVENDSMSALLSPSKTAPVTWIGQLLNIPKTSVLLAGLDIGIVNFMGVASQTIGLEHTSAVKATFLVQLTGVVTPLLAYFYGNKISRGVWAAGGLGLLGSIFFAFENMDASAVAGGGSMALNRGDMFTLGSCFFYGMSTNRLSILAPHFDSLQLAAVKKATLAVASLLWAGTTVIGASASMGSSDIVQQLFGRSALSGLLMVYLSLGPGSMASFLQARGQSSVPAAQAQVMYSLVPLWAAAIAWVLLPDSEALGFWGWAGGGVIVGAGLLAAFSQYQEVTLAREAQAEKGS